MRLRLIGARPSGTAEATLVLTRTTAGAAALLVSRLPRGVGTALATGT